MPTHRHSRLPLWPYFAILGLLGIFLYANLAWLRRVRFPFGAYNLVWSYDWARILRDHGLLAMLRAWFDAGYYPPLSVSLWAVVHRVLGVGRASVPIADALIFVPGLFALYAVGRRAANHAAAGLLAASLMLVAPFVAFYSRVTLYEVPMSAMLAVVLWGLLASERFTRMPPLAAAAVAFAAGMLMKWTFAAYAAGPVVIAVIDAITYGVAQARVSAVPVVTARQVRNASLAALLAASLAAPWYVFGLNWREIAATAPADATPGGPLAQAVFYLRVLDTPVLSPYLLIPFLACLPLLFLGERRREAIWIAASFAAGYAAISLVPHKEPRYATVLAPLCTLVIGAGLLNAGARLGKRGVAAAIVLGAAIFAAGAANVYRLSFLRDMVPLDSGDLVDRPHECLDDLDLLWTRLEPLLGRVSADEVHVAFHPFVVKTVAVSEDLLLYLFKERETEGGKRARCVGFENHHYFAFERRLPEADILLVTQEVWDMTREDVARSLADMAAFLNPGGAAPPVPEHDPLYKELVESSYNLVETVPLKCSSLILIYMRKGL